jgi:hypothetical protein
VNNQRLPAGEHQRPAAKGGGAVESRDRQECQCRNGGGWVLGHLVDGVQAQFARLPFADLSTYKLPPAIPDEAAVLLAGSPVKSRS